jgi:hypothetical protein
MTSTHTTKWENLEPEQMVENYIRLKEIEILRNKKKMQEKYISLDPANAEKN